MPEHTWRPKKSSNVLLHYQIQEYIRRKISVGEWPTGFKLASQRTLAQKFEVNRSTVVTAIEELMADGLLETRIGSGTRVANHTWNVLASNPPDWEGYVKSGVHAPNLAMIQEINRAEVDPTIIRLGTGELSPDLLPAESMKSMMAMEDASHLELGYVEPKGSLMLREAIRDHLKGKQIEVSPDSILIVSGAVQALQLIAIGLLKRGSIVLYEVPSYLNSIHVFQSAGMNLLGVPLDGEGMQTEAIGRLKRQKDATLLYSIPSFHNPTGTLMSERRRMELMTVSEEASLPIIEDDVYGELWFDEEPPAPLKANDTQGNVIYIGSVSKSLSPGLRIGWVFGPEPVINRLADIKMQTDYGSSSISQHLVEKWIRSGVYQTFIEQTRIRLKERRDFVVELLNKYFTHIATWNIPSGGFYIWLELKGDVSITKLLHLALKDGILLNPGMVYDKLDQNHLRISYSYASKGELERGLRRVAELVNMCTNE
ncbi:PLP-dependent aminotransferase family protein [Exiguobacterium sp. s22]|uniref:aminotransferase-like domain-containing protein n=1 Tax=Exiguobacterium sp. s22 TaxID=2751272 RepID=UPI001BEA093A|nr:PLP-dependent aminotransferase family protein [Exiguobacterium sp. s22]